MSLDDVARETRLSKRYLIALEDHAIAKLPGGAYNRAYLKTYATFLGLDPEPLLREYVQEELRHAETAEQDQLAAMNRALERRGTLLSDHASAEGAVESSASRRFSLIAVSLATLAVVVGAAWFGLSGFRRASSTLEVAGTEPAAPPTPKPGVESRPVPVSRAEATERSTAPPRPFTDAVRASHTTSPSHLTLAHSGVGTNIVDRKLVGVSDRFNSGSRVVFWTHVRGGRTGDTIDHVWFRDGALVGAASLPIGSDDWRTQSRRRLDPPGDWAVEARDAEGHVLARHEFHAASD